MSVLLKEFRGQRYLNIGTRDYRRSDGSLTTLQVWQSHCAECGEAFEFATPSRARRFEPNRRCRKHKRPGQRVKI